MFTLSNTISGHVSLLLKEKGSGFEVKEFHFWVESLAPSGLTQTICTIEGIPGLIFPSQSTPFAAAANGAILGFLYAWRFLLLWFFIWLSFHNKSSRQLWVCLSWDRKGQHVLDVEHGCKLLQSTMTCSPAEVSSSPVPARSRCGSSWGQAEGLSADLGGKPDREVSWAWPLQSFFLCPLHFCTCK